MTTKWLVRQRRAAERDLAEALALGRQDAKRRADADREREAVDRDARKVGSAIRKAERAARKMHFPLRAYPAFVEGRREGRVRMKRFKQALALALPKKVGGGHTSSFHFRIRGRGLGTWRKAKGYPYRRGEAVRTIRYILRENAREIANGGVVSSISEDPDRIASLLAALEELELTAGRGNATVYWSLVVSLPHELTSEQRLALLEEICAPFRELGLPFAAVLHAPDPDGDQRNNHAHVVGSWRPFRTKDDGSFEFADRTLSALNTPEAIFELRERASEAMNRAMTAAGHRRRFTPESNAARGLPPVSKLAGKSSVGQKDRERKLRAIEAMKAKKALLMKRRSALEGLATAVAKLSETATTGLGSIIANLATADRRLAEALAMAARTASLPDKPMERKMAQVADGVVIASSSEPSPMHALSSKQLDTVSMAVEAADTTAIDPKNVAGSPADAKSPNPPIHTVGSISPIKSLPLNRDHQGGHEARLVSHEKPAPECPLNPQQTDLAAFPARQRSDRVDQTSSRSESRITGTTRKMLTGSTATSPDRIEEVTSESSTAANHRGEREQVPISAVTSEGKALSESLSASLKQANVASTASARCKDRNRSGEPPKATPEEWEEILGKLPGRRKSNEADQPTTNRERGDIGKIREVLRQRGHKKTAAASHIARSIFEVGNPSANRPIESGDTKARAHYQYAKPKVPSEEVAPRAENSAKPHFEHVSQFGQADDDDRRKRQRKRKTVLEAAEKTAVEGDNSDTAAKAPQSDRATDLALVADLFHSVEWDPREFRTDIRRPDRWSHTITEAEDLDYLAMLSAHAARGGNSRS